MTYHHGIKGVDVGYLETVAPGIEAEAGTPILANELRGNMATVVIASGDDDDIVEVVQGWDRIVIPRPLWARFVAELGAVLGEGA